MLHCVGNILSKYKNKQWAISSPAYCEVKCYINSGLKKIFIVSSWHSVDRELAWDLEYGIPLFVSFWMTLRKFSICKVFQSASEDSDCDGLHKMV